MYIHWVTYTPGDIEIERTQALQEGRDLAALLPRFEEAAAADHQSPTWQAEARALMDEVQRLPIVPGYAFDEPSDLESIRARRGPGPALGAMTTDEAVLLDRLHGAWLGRCCGCLLGKPVEGWRRDRMHGYLRDLGRYPLDRYFTTAVPDEVRQRYELDPRSGGFVENATCMPEDDDTNYTVTGIAVVRHKAHGFTAQDVADFWLGNIPLLHVCTAERVAYRNLVHLVPPPASASLQNPYREWIGAQIRADAWAYVAPGNPELAAEYAWRDAIVSHVKNGIYGEMWAAATIAAAFRTEDPLEAVRAGIAQVPERSRLAEALARVIAWRVDGADYETALERIHAEWDEHRAHDWCHTISNAMIVVLGLLWGEGDFARSICLAVNACFDTDCNGATVGSVMGALLGRARLPEDWARPINDTLETGVAGYHRVSLTEMARLTLELGGRQRWGD